MSDYTLNFKSSFLLSFWVLFCFVLFSPSMAFYCLFLNNHNETWERRNKGKEKRQWREEWQEDWKKNGEVVSVKAEECRGSWGSVGQIIFKFVLVQSNLCYQLYKVTRVNLKVSIRTSTFLDAKSLKMLGFLCFFWEVSFSDLHCFCFLWFLLFWALYFMWEDFLKRPVISGWLLILQKKE